jgi:hypothetical protein
MQFILKLIFFFNRKSQSHMHTLKFLVLEILSPIIGLNPLHERWACASIPFSFLLSQVGGLAALLQFCFVFFFFWLSMLSALSL